MADTAFQRSGEPWRAPPDEGSRAETSGKRSLGRPYSQSGIYIHGVLCARTLLEPWSGWYPAGALERPGYETYFGIDLTGPGVASIR